MRKLITGLLASLGMVMALMAVTVTSASASPAGTVDYSTPWKCVTAGGVGYSITTCASLDWGRQSDGDGARLEGIQVWTSNGCKDFAGGAGWPRYNPVDALWQNNNGTTNYQYRFGEEPCDFYKDVSNAGSDTGTTTLWLQAQMNISYHDDRVAYFGWKLKGDGTWTLLQQEVGSA